MKKLLLITLFSFVLLTGCGNGATEENTGNQPPTSEVTKIGLTGNEPPKAEIQIDDKLYETKLGTYCWTSENQGRCVDSIGPVELLKDKKAISVSPGAVVKFVMDYEPLPNKSSVEQFTEDNQLTNVAVKDYTFQAPAQKGTYYYSYGVWWMDDKEENVAHGDAFYYFALEVI